MQLALQIGDNQRQKFLDPKIFLFRQLFRNEFRERDVDLGDPKTAATSVDRVGRLPTLLHRFNLIASVSNLTTDAKINETAGR